MKLISHRRNTVAELKSTDYKYGVEVDIRSKDGQLIIAHDPFVLGESFEEWIKFYHHGTLILNVKEDGLELKLMEVMASKKIKDYFFLDVSFPSLIKLAQSGQHRCAVRVSEFESIETALSLAGMVEWVWVDCFNCFPLTHKKAQDLINAGFKLCIVSPELQNKNPEIEILAFSKIMQENQIKPHAVCTKRMDLWNVVYP